MEAKIKKLSEENGYLKQQLKSAQESIERASESQIVVDSPELKLNHVEKTKRKHSSAISINQQANPTSLVKPILIDSGRFASAFKNFSQETQDNMIEDLKITISRQQDMIERYKEMLGRERKESHDTAYVFDSNLNASFDKMLDGNYTDNGSRSARLKKVANPTVYINEEYEDQQETPVDDQSNDSSMIDLQNNTELSSSFNVNIDEQDDQTTRKRGVTDIHPRGNGNLFSQFNLESIKMETGDNQSQKESASKSNNIKRSFKEPQVRFEDVDEDNKLVKSQQVEEDKKILQFVRRNSRQQRSGDISALKDIEVEVGFHDYKSAKSLKTRPNAATLKKRAIMFAKLFNKIKPLESKVQPDYSRDYLDILKYKQVREYLNKIQDRSTNIFSDCISVYKNPTSKKTYILLSTCIFS